MAVLADYFKAFDTVAFETVLRKLRGLGFSTANFRLIVSYLTDRKPFVQIDENRHFGPQFGLKIRQGGRPPGPLPWFRHC